MVDRPCCTENCRAPVRSGRRQMRSQPTSRSQTQRRSFFCTLGKKSWLALRHLLRLKDKQRVRTRQKKTANGKKPRNSKATSGGEKPLKTTREAYKGQPSLSSDSRAAPCNFPRPRTSHLCPPVETCRRNR